MTILACLASLALAAAVPQAAPEPAATAVSPATLMSYAGTYRTERGADAVVALALDGTLTIEINGPPLKMRPLSPTEFAVDAKRAKVVFDSDDGKVSGFTVSMGPRQMYATRVR